MDGMINKSNQVNVDNGTGSFFSSMQVNNDDDNIEWVIRSPSPPPSPSPQISKLVSKYADDDYIRAQLRGVKFFGSKFRSPSEILADDINQMALIFNPNTLRFSICYDEMKYEVSIPYHQLLGCTIKDERMMEIRVKRESTKLFFFHPEGFPYISSPIELDDDPTGGKFTFCERMIVKALHASDFGFLKRIKFEIRQVENATRLKRIQNMKSSIGETGSCMTIAQQISRRVTTSVFHVIKTKKNPNFTESDIFNHERENSQFNLNQNSLVNGRRFENGNSYKEQKEPEQLYITVTFPTRKCAMLYPIDGSLYYLQMQLKNRFEKKYEWRFLWYKSSNGYWDRLINEKDWQFAIHERLREKGFIRIEIYMKP